MTIAILAAPAAAQSCLRDCSSPISDRSCALPGDSSTRATRMRRPSWATCWG